MFDHAERYRLGASPSRLHWKLRQSEHRAIFDAAVARDADLTAGLLSADNAHTAGLVCRALDADRDPARLRADAAVGGSGRRGGARPADGTARATLS